MNINNICSIFNYLPDYIPLIQLLVGSVFVAGYMSKGLYSFSNIINKIRDILESVVGDSSDYELIKTETEKTEEITFDHKKTHTFTKTEVIKLDAIRLNTDYSTIKKSIMLIMALYGAFVLFYCATFPPKKMFIPPYIPSPLGILLLSLIVTIFLLCSYYFFGRTKPNKVWSFVVAIIMFTVFLTFFILLPDWQPFPNGWNYNLHILANIWCLFNLSVLGLSILLRKRVLPDILQFKACNYKLDLNLVSRANVVERMERITDEVPNYKYIFRLNLLWKAVRTLRRDCLYFNYSITGQTREPLDVSRLSDIINNSDFNRLSKHLLRLFINKKPRINTKKVAPNNIAEIDKQRKKIIQRYNPRFIAIGIIVKRPV